MKGITIMHILASLLLLTIASCAAAKPDTLVSPRLDSGVTSSASGGYGSGNKGPNVGINTTTGVAR